MTIMGTWAIGAFTKGSNWEPGVDFGRSTTHDPGTHPAVPPRHLRLHGRTPHPEECQSWLDVVASPELQIPTDVTQGGMFARTDIDPMGSPIPSARRCSSS